MRKVLSLILVLMMLVSIVPVSVFADEAEMPAEADTPIAAEASTDAGDPAAAEEEESATSAIIDSGTCGENLTWTLDENGLFTVSGEGDMYDYNYDYVDDGEDHTPPWSESVDSISAIVIEDGVTSIGNSSFEYCMSAESISLPEGLTRIGSYAFAMCYGITQITIPESVVSIDSFAFGECVSLSNVYVPAGVTDLGEFAFAVGFSMTEINVDEDNPNYASVDGVLYDKNITRLMTYPAGKAGEFSIPDSVTCIERAALRCCTSITSVNVPASVDSIGEYAFFECISMTCAKFEGDAPTTVGGNAFYACADDFAIYAPAANKASWQTPDAYDAEAQTWHGWPIVFYGEEPASPEIIASGYCGGDTTAEYDEASGAYKNLSWTLDDAGTLTVSGTGKMMDFEQSEYSLGRNVPWDEWENLVKKVIVEPGVTNIGVGAFEFCGHLSEVVISEGVTKIGDNAFTNPLKSLSLPSSLTNVYGSAFYHGAANVYYAGDMSSWVGITFENRWTNPLHNGGNLYIGGELVEHAVIPASAGYINDNAFFGCTSITDVTISDGVTGIGECAFGFCGGLKTVSIPASVNYMGPEAFTDCENLEDVSISKDSQLTCIEYYTFAECFNLKHVDIPDSVTEIGPCGIYFCTSLEEVTIPQGVKIIGGAAFYQDETLESVVIPDSVEILDEAAFAYCWNLSSVTLGSGITSIGPAAFDGCPITEITIPAGVTEIMEIAFCECSALEKATFLGDAPTTFEDAVFDLCADNFTIYAPRGYSGWTDPAVFDADAQTWHGYPIVFYGEDPDFPKIIASGYCGGDTTAEYDEVSHAYKNLSWTLDDTFTLTVSGNGMMMDRVEDNRPWDVYTGDIKTVIIEEGVTTIGVGAFAEFYALEELTLPESLEAIYGQAFLGCGAYAHGGLESVFIPKNVRCIQPMAFCDCYNLKSIEIDEDNPYFTSDGLMVYTKDMKTLVYYETKDTELVISDGITDICLAAFYYNETIESVTIPASVEAIDPGTFYICTNLSCAKFEGDAPSRAASMNPDTFIREGMFLYEDVTPGFLPEIIFLECARDFKILAPECNTTWKGEGYDAEAQTWYGYPIEFYGEHSYAVSSEKEATCTEQGEIVYTCPVCGDSYTEYTPALGHDYVDGVCTRCGDVTTVGGSCGDTEWELSPDGTLTIGGSGSTGDSENPWEGIADRVTDIEVGSGVTELDFDAFDEFENLENINISGSSQNFSSINGVVYNKNANELIYCPKGKTGEYEVHGGLKTIRAYAFAGCTKLQVMVIANSITEIGDHAFDGCSSLVNVAFTDSEPRTVGKAIFDNCAPDFCISAVNANGKWLKSARYDAKTQTWNGYPIRFGEKTIVDSDNSGDVRWDVDKYGNLEIGSDGNASTAADLSNVRADVKTVSIAEGTTNIAAGQFENFENLEAVSVPDTVTEIGDGAFSGCENLYELSIPESVTDIGDGAFSGCDKLTEINVDENNPNYSSVDGKLYNKDGSELICVPAGAGDESFTVPESVDKIGDGAFADCGALTEVVMTEGITEIGAGAFEGCDNLESIKVENPAPKRLLMAAKSNAAAAVVSISLPDSVIVIGKDAFRDCDCINIMNISANVAVIGSGAFADCANLTAINVNANNASYCSVNGMLLSKDGKTLLCVPAGMSGEYTLPETVSAIADGAFDGCTAELTLICPDALKGCFFGKCMVKFAGAEEAHSYEKLVVAPTCTSEGYTVVIIDGIEGEHSDITEKLPHKYGAWHVTKAASCTENGMKERCCVCCGDVQTSVIECGHSYSYVVIAPSCTTDGCTRYTCDTCGDSYESDITPACHELAHHDGQAPTCTESGWAEYDTCLNCDYSTYEVIPAKGHSFGEWHVTKASTCTENGSEEHVCSECGASESRSVAKLGHDYQDGVCQCCGEQEPTNIFTEIANAINSAINAITNFFKNLFSWLPF